MERKHLFLVVLILLAILLFASCIPVPAGVTSEVTAYAELPTSTAVAATQPTAPNTQISIPERPITRIELAGPVADRSAEVSGLAWYGDSLIFLPQYPDIFDQNGDGFLYYLPKQEILAYLDGENSSPLEPRPIQLIAPGLREKITHYQGFESIGFSGDRVFLTIEAGKQKQSTMMGYLVSGAIQSDLSVLTLNTDKLTMIPPQTSMKNRADEALLVLGDKVITFYEINGAALNPSPLAHVFNFELEPLGTLSFPNIEYRITDAVWAQGSQFWAINYFFPDDMAMVPAVDPIAAAFGEGPTHAQNFQVERLLKFQYSDSGITLVDSPPIQLSLENEIRNWEGLVLLEDRGFLMATDKFPTTLLAFVPLPE